MRSAFVSASNKVTEQWEIAADGLYSRRDFRFTYPVPPDNFLVPSTNAFNHLGGDVLVAYDFSRDFGTRWSTMGRLTSSFISAGLKGVRRRKGGKSTSRAPMRRRLPSRSIPTSTSTTRPSMERLRAPTRRPRSISSGMVRRPHATALAALRAQGITIDDLEVASLLGSANMIADGPLFNWRAGAIRLAVGGEFRDEHSTGINIVRGPEDLGTIDSLGIFRAGGADDGSPHGGLAANRLDLSLSGRYDSYSDAGDTFNPKVGFSWRPSSLIELRGNWGTSFRALPLFLDQSRPSG